MTINKIKVRIRKRIALYNPVIRLMSLLGIEYSYAQNEEDLLVANYFRNYVGNLLSIGENDGKNLSNVLYFILRGWHADLIEPSPEAFRRLKKLHKHNKKVRCHNLAIGEKSEEAIFYESGEFIKTGDSGLVSSLSKECAGQWKGVKFKETKVQVKTFDEFYVWKSRSRFYDIISIDAESMDIVILKQINLSMLACRCLIIEHGGKTEDIDFISNYVHSLGFKTLVINQENLIAVI